MIFKVRELSGGEDTPSISGVDHDFDYLDEAEAKRTALESAGVRAMITVWFGPHPVLIDTIRQAIGAGTNAKVDAWAKTFYPEFIDVGPAQIVQFDDKQRERWHLYVLERVQRRVDAEREATDEMRGGA